jgi:hypothetical protein
MAVDLERELEAAEAELDDEPVEVARQGPKPREDVAAPLTPTPASSWVRDEPELHTLPSGNTALLTKPRTLAMIRKGEIPNPLLAVAMEAVQGKTPENIAEAVDFLEFMVSVAFVEPKVWVPEDDVDAPLDALPIDALTDADKNYVLIWMQRGVAGLASFRDLAAGADDGGDGRGLRDEAE